MTPKAGCAALSPPYSPPANLPAFLAPLVESLDSADAFELDAWLWRALRIEQRWLAEMGPLLLEVARSPS